MKHQCMLNLYHRVIFVNVHTDLQIQSEKKHPTLIIYFDCGVS